MAINAFATLTELAAALTRREVSALELAELYLARIARANPKLNAYVAVYAELARAQARAADARRAGGLVLGPLDGLPIALKDLLEIEGRVTTAGSALWKERRSPTTATVVEKLAAAGMVFLGKTQMVEFAFGTWGTNPHLGAPWNPWDLATQRVPGGSSSGSGVAVAAGLAPAAIGSDTGGSVRIPSALNGITGLKTSGGLVSLHGVIPLSFSLDTIGPMTRDAEDAALLLAAIAGPDPLDVAHQPANLHAPRFDLAAALGGARGREPLAGLRVSALPEAQYPIDVDAAVTTATREAQRVLRNLGARVTESALPFDFDELIRGNLRLIAAEAYTIHRGYIEDESRPIGPGVRQRVLRGKGISAADYIDALERRRRACAAWIDWMRETDALLTPALPFAACPLAQVDEAIMPLASFTRAGNYLDASGLALPAGFTADGLPIGVQLLGKAFDEATLLRIGRAFQRATDWHRRTPQMAPLLD